MATDKHYNEPGYMPEPLQDRKPTDMPATRSMFVIILVVAVISFAALMVIQLME